MIISLAASVRNRAGRADFVNAVEQDFVGGVQERRPWANKREDRPKGAPNSSPQQPGFDRDARRKRGKQLETGTGNYRGALHQVSLAVGQGFLLEPLTKILGAAAGDIVQHRLAYEAAPAALRSHAVQDRQRFVWQQDIRPQNSTPNTNDSLRAADRPC